MASYYWNYDYEDDSDPPTQSGNIFLVDCSDYLIRDEQFYPIVIGPALIITLLFCFTKTRKRLYPHVLDGRPGLVYPMDLTTKSKRMAFACAFGSTTFLIMKILVNKLTLFQANGDFWPGLIALFSAVAFGLVYLPVFACLTMDSAVGYGVGALYTWMLTIVSFVQLWNCYDNMTTWFFRFLFILPYLLCCLYLNCINMLRFYQTFKRGEYLERKPETTSEDNGLEKIRSSVAGRHVRCLLLPKPPQGQTRRSLPETVLNFILDHTYRRDPKFQFSARFLATVFTGTIILYQLVFYLAFISLGLLNLTGTFLNIFIISLVLATLLSGYNILRHVTCYRRDSYRMYRGELKDKMMGISNAGLLVGAMKYSGYQVVHIFLSFIVNLIMTCLLGFLFYQVICHDLWLVGKLFLYLSPILFWFVVNMVGQYLAARFIFLQNPLQSLAITNRRALFIFAYIIFFLNIILGIFVFILRLYLNLFISLFLLNRLDQSSFPSGYIHWDGAYQAYLGSLKLECSQTHPAMLVFVQLLTWSSEKRKREEVRTNVPLETHCGTVTDSQAPADSDSKDQIKRRRLAAFHWHLVYTLINNPSIRMDRRGYVQKLKRARELGISIPKSDVTIDQYSICHLVAELEREGNISTLSAADQTKEDAQIFRGLLVRIQSRFRGGRSRLDEEAASSQLWDSCSEDNIQDGRHRPDSVV